MFGNIWESLEECSGCLGECSGCLGECLRMFGWQNMHQICTRDTKRIELKYKLGTKMIGITKYHMG
jgi:hypothetical protein